MIIAAKGFPNRPESYVMALTEQTTERSPWLAMRFTRPTPIDYCGDDWAESFNVEAGRSHR
jgi:hypothetical protein